MKQNLTLYHLYQPIDFELDKPAISVLEASFVHISYFEEKGNTKEVGNSRLVFLGMYAFKGRLASLIEQFISGNGKQLQHYLGNIFTNERLVQIYDELKFEKISKAGSKFEIDKHKHIFTLGYLGFLEQYASSQFLEKQAFALFLKDIKFEGKKVGLNILQILKAKTEAVLQSKLKILNESNGQGISLTHTTKVVAQDGLIIGQHTSKSKLYAKNKAIKLGLNYILEKEQSLPNVAQFAKVEKEKQEIRKEKTKNAKQIEHQKMQAEKKEKRLKIIAEKKKLANEREIQRSLNKTNAKKNKEFAIKKEKNAKLSENLSAKNLQRLKDKSK